MLKKVFFSFLFLYFIKFSCFGIYDSTLITINGLAYDSIDRSRRLEDLMIINLRTSHGTFGKADGSFTVWIMKSDTIVIASSGYAFQNICFADSIIKENYTINVPLFRLNINLKEVTIFSPRDLQSIYTDIQKLGYNKKDFQLSTVDALSSPITFLYQEFSAIERLKRHNKERINNEKRRDLLKQLLANYVAAAIINLDDFEFDDFINFCNVPEQLMKTATQYDFCIYIKQKFELYAMMKKRN
jgi:hypothetical protein